MRPWTVLAALPLLAALLAGPASALECALDAAEGPEARWWHAGVWRELTTAPLPEAEGVIVSTPAGARVELLCEDGTRVTLGPETEVNLASLLPSPPHGVGAAAVQLLDGIVGLAVEARRGLGFELRAPLAIASVRSTRWLAEADRAHTAFFVREGRVRVRPTDEGPGRSLDPGEGLDLRPGEPVGPVVEWGAPRVAETRARLGLSWR